MTDVAPAVRVLDFGWQAPNPIDYQRAALTSTEPMQRAVSEAMAARNQFALSRLNNAQAMQRELAVASLNYQRARELAQWQHAAQIQREKMRDDRMVEIAKRKADAAMAEIREKHDLNSLEKSIGFLRNQVGGQVPERQAGETDAAYKNRVDAAATAQIQTNVQADAQAKVAIRNRRDQLNDYLTSNAPAFAQLNQAAAANTRDQAQLAAQNAFLASHQQVADLVNQGTPFRDALARTGTALDFMDAFNGYHQAYQTRWLHEVGGVAGGAAKSLAAVKSELQMLDNQEKNLDSMPGENGRTVPRLWASRSSNLADEIMLKQAQERQKNLPVANPTNPTNPTNPFLPLSARTAPPNPVTPPLVNPTDFDAQGHSLNTAPLATKPGNTLGFGAWDEGTGPGDAASIAMFGPRTRAADWTDLDRAKAEAANPGFWNGMLHAPGYWVRQVGSLFDSRINPNNAFTPGADASYFVPPVKPTAPIVNPVSPKAPVVAPAVSAPIAANPATMQFVPPPAAAPIPAGAIFAPGAGMYAPNFQPEVANGTSGYDDALNFMRMRSLYSNQ